MNFLPLHVEGRHLVDSKGNVVRYRGTMQSLSPFFSHGRWGGGTDDDAVARALDYFRELIDMMSDRSQGSPYNMIRLTDDTYWCNDDAKGKDRLSRFDFACHRRYIDKVLVPLAEYAVSKGIYVIIRPSMNTEQDTHVGDDLQKHFVKEWAQFASNKRLQALSGWVSFELENEPINVRNRDNKDDPAALADYMQPMIDIIREKGFKGVVWVPGAGFQSLFQGFMTKMVKDPLDNFGFAAHIYPGWYCQPDEKAEGESFLSHILEQIPVVRNYPVVVTECDWSPEKPGQGRLNEFGDYVPANHGTWGTATTSRWGKALRYAVEKLGNVSMMVGGMDNVLDVDHYLKTAEVRTPKAFKNDLESVGPYVFHCWFRDWAREKPQPPAVTDRTAKE